MIRAGGLAALSIGICGAASSQNVAGVFGPGVERGDRSVEYRAALAPDASGDGFVHRVHAQYAFDHAWRARLVLQGGDVETGTLEFTFAQAELQWQYAEAGPGRWAQAVRLDARLTDGDDGADLLALNWTGQRDIGAAWRTVLVGQVSGELGDDRRSGAFVQTRASFTRALPFNLRAGAELFNFYGSTADFQDVNDQVHQAGPVVTGGFGEGWTFLAGALVGLTSASADIDVRFWLAKRF